jgi:anti-anti-sigma factor
MMYELRTDRPITRLACVSEMKSEAMLVHIMGHVDLGTVPMLWSNLNAMREDDLNVIVDLRGIQYIDSAGIDTLAAAYELFNQCGQRFLLAGPSSVLRPLLGEIAEPAGAIPLFASVAAARAWMRSAALVRADLSSGILHAAPRLSAV